MADFTTEELDKKLSTANSNQQDKIKDIMQGALNKVFSTEESDSHTQMLFTACIALKSLIVEHIDPFKLLKTLDTDDFQVRRALACIEAMRKIQELEEQLEIEDVLEQSAEVLGVDEKKVDDLKNHLHKAKDQDREVQEQVDKLTKGALDVFKSTESGKA
jgi:chorismate mutase